MRYITFYSNLSININWYMSSVSELTKAPLFEYNYPVIFQGYHVRTTPPKKPSDILQTELHMVATVQSTMYVTAV